MNTSRSRKRSRHEHEAHQQKLKEDVKRLHEWHEMLAKQAKRREDAPSFAAAAQQSSSVRSVATTAPICKAG